MRRITVLMLFTLMGLNMQAQKSNFFDNVNFEVKSIYGVKQHGMTPLNLNMQLSYEFANRWSLLASAEANRTLFNVDGSKWYTKSTSLGGGLAYTWLQENHQHFDLRLQVLNTIGSPDWKYTTYDIGTTWYGKPSKRGVAPILGFGFRHQKSHTAGIRDWSGFYATVGIRF